MDAGFASEYHFFEKGPWYVEYFVWFATFMVCILYIRLHKSSLRGFRNLAAGAVLGWAIVDWERILGIWGWEDSVLHDLEHGTFTEVGITTALALVAVNILVMRNRQRSKSNVRGRFWQAQDLDYLSEALEVGWAGLDWMKGTWTDLTGAEKAERLKIRIKEALFPYPTPTELIRRYYFAGQVDPHNKQP